MRDSEWARPCHEGGTPYKHHFKVPEVYRHYCLGCTYRAPDGIVEIGSASPAAGSKVSVISERHAGLHNGTGIGISTTRKNTITSQKQWLSDMFLEM